MKQETIESVFPSTAHIADIYFDWQIIALQEEFVRVLNERATAGQKISKVELAREMGLNWNKFSRQTKMKRPYEFLLNLRGLADAGIDVGRLIGLTVALGDKEKRLLNGFRALDHDGKEAALKVVLALDTAQNFKERWEEEQERLEWEEWGEIRACSKD